MYPSLNFAFQARLDQRREFAPALSSRRGGRPSLARRRTCLKRRAHGARSADAARGLFVSTKHFFSATGRILTVTRTRTICRVCQAYPATGLIAFSSVFSARLYNTHLALTMVALRLALSATTAVLVSTVVADLTILAPGGPNLWWGESTDIERSCYVACLDTKPAFFASW
jgi:hypothetical protein